MRYEVQMMLVKRGGFSSRGLVARIAFAVGLLFCSALSAAAAEDMPGLADPRSPLISLPLFRAEGQVSLVWMTISSGQVTNDRTSRSDGLREDLGLDSGQFFVDCMARLQAGRFSGRVVYEPRNFVGEKRTLADPAIVAQSRFEYEGVRLGLDVDIAQWHLSRVGINGDMDLFSPEFIDTIRHPVGLRMLGKRGGTLGFHIVYNPVNCFYGLSPLVEVRARWPITGTEITDLALAAGIRIPETVFGSLAWKSGYRHTRIEYSAEHHTLNTLMDGWFTELAYYY
jgi:hypothetical protein